MRQHTILLVDDELSLLEAVGDLLEAKGYLVTRASGGADAIKALENQAFHLVISDLELGEPDGIMVMRTAKEKKTGTKVMIFTGSLDVARAVSALRFGADDYLLKPATSAELLERVEKNLGRG